jgi:GntR family transcriptional regulator
MERVENVPLYHQVKRHILDRIDRGEWSVGRSIPSEHDFSAQLGVSRATVVRALTDLVHMGVLERRQGRGTFVAAPRVDHGPVALQSFTEEMAQRGLSASARVLECTEVEPDEDTRAVLRLGPTDRAVRLVRLRLGDGAEPMGVQTAHLPAALVPNLGADRDLRAGGSLYRTLRDTYGLRLARAVETVQPVLLTAKEAGLLGCPRSVPAFAVERITYDPTGRPVEFVRSRLRGDRYRYVLDLKSV